MTPDHGIDRVLDRTVLPGYTSVGFAVRRRTWRLDDPRPDALAGRRALVTGAGGGLGEAMALGLARLGATVHLLVRSADRAQPALGRISAALRADPGRTAALHVEECDVADLSSVRQFAASFTRRYGAGPGEAPRRGDPDSAGGLDVLIHNAGVLPKDRTTTADGHELTVATHVLGPILMTELLLPVLREARSGARTILVSSGGQYTQPLPVDDPDFIRGRYRGAVAYARSKRMQVELTPLLAERWAPDAVSVYAMHPGWANTPGITGSLPVFRAAMRLLLRTPEQGADTAVWLAGTDPAPPSGSFWHDRQQRPTSYVMGPRPTADERERVWEWARSASGIG